jgi:hypothetical protein
MKKQWKFAVHPNLVDGTPAFCAVDAETDEWLCQFVGTSNFPGSGIGVCSEAKDRLVEKGYDPYQYGMSYDDEGRPKIWKI